MYKDAKTGLMLINVADFDLLNDQALTPQLLRASKPTYALAATIPPPTCLTGGSNASGEHVNILRSLTRLPGNHTLRFTHVAIGLDVMDEYPGTDGLFRRYISERHCGRIRDFSLGDREDRQMLVKTLRRRFPEEVHQTNIVLIDCRALRDPSSSAVKSTSPDTENHDKNGYVKLYDDKNLFMTNVDNNNSDTTYTNKHKNTKNNVRDMDE